jgi:hypothetical protein
VGPTVLTGSTPSRKQSILKNISAATAGANAVTVTFNTAAACSDVRILEYSGISTVNPLDVTAASTGNSATSISSAAITTNALDLLVGANMVVQIVTVVGSYSASASFIDNNGWVMQMVAFGAAGSATPTAQSIPAAIAYVQGNPRSGFTPRLLTNPDGDIAEDERIAVQPETERHKPRERRLPRQNGARRAAA